MKSDRFEWRRTRANELGQVERLKAEYRRATDPRVSAVAKMKVWARANAKLRGFPMPFSAAPAHVLFVRAHLLFFSYRTDSLKPNAPPSSLGSD